MISEEQLAQLTDEVELLDGASAEFDMELVSKGELSPVFFWIGSYKLWCGDISSAFSSDDKLSPSENLG